VGNLEEVVAVEKPTGTTNWREITRIATSAKKCFPVLLEAVTGKLFSFEVLSYSRKYRRD
jgi:hypothetical protein